MLNSLNWGTVTPEFYSKEKNSAVHVFNHCLIDEASVDRTIKFAIGRIEWYKNFLPDGCAHEVVFDDRGQDIDDNVRNRITESLRGLAVNVKFMSKGK